MKWTCPTCGYKCEATPSGNDYPRIEHLATHNPSPAQWADAYRAIEAGRDAAKAKAKADG